MPTKEELYEIYLELGGTQIIEEVMPSTWMLLRTMWYLRNIKENTDND